MIGIIIIVSIIYIFVVMPIVGYLIKKFFVVIDMYDMFGMRGYLDYLMIGIIPCIIFAGITLINLNI